MKRTEESKFKATTFLSALISWFFLLICLLPYFTVFLIASYAILMICLAITKLYIYYKKKRVGGRLLWDIHGQAAAAVSLTWWRPHSDQSQAGSQGLAAMIVCLSVKDKRDQLPHYHLA